MLAKAIAPRANIPPDHLDIGHQMMAEGHGLGDLQMRETRHHRRGMRFQCRRFVQWLADNVWGQFVE